MAEIICVVCNETEGDQNKVITCMYCFSSAHFHCKKIIGSAINRIKASLYFCSPNCSEIYQKIMQIQNDKDSVLSSISADWKITVQNVVSAEMSDVRSEVRSFTTAIENSQEFLSSKFDSILSEFKDLKTENANLKQEIQDLKKAHASLTGIVHKLETNVDKTNRNVTNNNAIFLGLPSIINESASDTINKVLVKLGITSPSDGIVSVERLFSNSKNGNPIIPIRVVFRSKSFKELLLAKKKGIGKLLSTSIDESWIINGRPTIINIRDELTPLAMEMINELRESQELLKIKFIWAGRGGTVLVKKDEHSKTELVKNREDLRRVMNHFLNSSTHIAPPSNSNSLSPKRKKNKQRNE